MRNWKTLLIAASAAALATSMVACGSTSGGGDGGGGTKAGGGGDGKPARAEVWCDFGKGYAALVPKALYDPNERFLMQILIGLHEESDTFDGEEYAKYKPYAATPCEGDINGQFTDVKPGEYMLLVGWVGRYSVDNSYENNGWKKAITLKGGDVFSTRLKDGDMTHSWACISCPFLSMATGKGWVELGQVLRNRRSPRLGGTDTVSLTAEVKAGVVTLRLDEKEPETTYLDAVSLTIGGKVAPRIGASTNDRISAVDGRFHTMVMGDSLVLEFAAPKGVADGPVKATLSISGHYVPVVDM